MLRTYLENNTVDNFPNKEITELINNYMNKNTDHNLQLLTTKLDEIKYVMPAIFEEGKLKSISLTTDENSNQYIPIFTSVDEYEKYEANTSKNFNGYMIDTLANIASILLLGNNDIYGIAIDPYGINISLTKDAVKDKNIVIYKEFKDTKEINENIIIGNPKYISEELINNLNEYFKNLYYVNKAYIALLKQEEDYRYVVVVDMDISENMFIASDIGSELSHYSIFPLQVMVTGYDDIINDIISITNPIYEKIDK